MFCSTEISLLRPSIKDNFQIWPASQKVVHPCFIRLTPGHDDPLICCLASYCETRRLESNRRPACGGNSAAERCWRRRPFPQSSRPTSRPTTRKRDSKWCPAHADWPKQDNYPDNSFSALNLFKHHSHSQKHSQIRWKTLSLYEYCFTFCLELDISFQSQKFKFDTFSDTNWRRTKW